jgi:hypothetical protein
MRKRFDKSPAIDAASNLRLVSMIQNHDEPYTKAEEEIFEKGMAEFSKFNELKGKKLAMRSPTTTAKFVYEEGQGHAYGWSSATVRASPVQVAAFVWNTEARGKARDDDLEKAVDERPNAHNMVMFNWKKTTNIIDDRDFLSRAVWRKREDGGFEVVTTPTESNRRGPLPKTTRARFPSAMKILKVGEDETGLEYVIQPDWGGQVGKNLAWQAVRNVASNLARVTEIQEHFLALRCLDEMDEEDGKATGEVLVAKTKAEKHHGKGETKVGARVCAMVEKYKGLRELGEKHTWFEVLLKKVVANKLRPAGDSQAKLCNMSVKEANVIGGALASCIAANLTAPAAVDEWIRRYRALGELEREYVRERSERKNS